MIHRAEHKTEFVRISWSLLRDERLSLESRGFLAYCLTLSDKWDFSISGLSSMLGVSKKTVMRLVKELKSLGYITQTKVKDKSGHFSSYEWNFYEIPELPENGTSAKPNFRKTELPSDGTSVRPNFRERVAISNDISISNEIIESRTKKFVPPTVEEVRAYCESRNNSIDPEAFVAFYNSKGWKVGKNPMKDWKSAVITWEKRQKKDRPRTGPITEENPFTRLRREEGFI
jgi:hypothetical protein